MRCVIVYTSVHHHNTEKVARAMAGALDAGVVRTAEATEEAVISADLAGFGSGIYFGTHHKGLLSFAESLPMKRDGRAFIFSTSGNGSMRSHRRLRDLLSARGYEIVGEFACKGWDSYSVLRLVGGINKGRPNGEDLERAAAFASGLVPT
ncbi:MAG: flavodoxin family protein [Methanospirillum sp.]